MDPIEKLKLFYKDYRGEILISTFFLLFDLIVSAYFAIFIEDKTTWHFIFLTFAIGISIGLIVLLFNQKRLFNKKFEHINHILKEQFGFAHLENLYYQRQSHWHEEKLLLAKIVTKKALPELLKNLDNTVNRVNIILDSGSTITPIFPRLLREDIRQKENKNISIQFFTNNLAGIDEVHKSNFKPTGTLTEKNMVLLGGHTKGIYRATTGVYTDNMLNLIFVENKRKTSSREINIGVVTSNWFKGQAGMHELTLLVRGEGHRDFKEKIINNADHLIIVTPLGKILKIDDTTILNNHLPEDYGKYHEIKIPPEKTSATHLVTTTRSKNSLSPLNYSMSPQKIKNCTWFKGNEIFEPKGNTREEVFKVEIPHKYIGKDYRKFYNL